MITAKAIEVVNRVVNHPRVRPWVGGDGVSQADLEPVISRKSVVCNFGDGFLMFLPMGAGVWEVHCAFEPKAWGFRAYRCARNGLDYMFDNGATRIIGRPQVTNTRTGRFCTALGFINTGFERVGGDIPYDASVYELTRKGKPCQPPPQQ